MPEDVRQHKNCHLDNLVEMVSKNKKGFVLTETFTNARLRTHNDGHLVMVTGHGHLQGVIARKESTEHGIIMAPA